MGRPSKLTPAQWSDVERRLLNGEGVRALAREFGCDPAAISRRLSQQSQRVHEVAQRVANARNEQDRALATLPSAQQFQALSLAEKLRNISASLASAAELGAATSHRLNALANSEVSKIDDANPLASMDNIKSATLLSGLANASATIALNLLAANKVNSSGENIHDDESARLARLSQIMAAAQKRKADAGDDRVG